MILIVDDNQANIFSLKKLLHGQNFQVDTAFSGEEALSKALKNQYDLIILDVQMPDMDGFEVAETFAGYSKTKEIPIIFLSAANTDKRFITKGYASGGIDYVTKPIDPDILLLKVKTYYSIQEQNRALKKSQQSLELEVQGRRETQVILKSQIDHFQQMLEALPQIAFTLNNEGELEFVNQHWFQYSNSAQAFPEFHPDDQSVIDVFSKEKNKLEVITVETRIKNIETEEYRYHLLRMSPIMSQENVKNWIGTFTDINSQKKIEKEKGEFLSIASHELKTPLTSIKAYVQLLHRKLKIDKNSPEASYLSKVENQVDKLNTLIADLLDISKIENGKLKINRQKHNLEEVVHNAIDVIVQTHEQDSVVIVREGTKPDFDVLLDSIRIEQVLINFLTNAIKYSPQNNRVIITCDQDENHVSISVKDFGIGIPEYKQADVFNKFYRVEESSLQFQGMGIGLYICAEIIQQHGGKIGLTSTLDQGSTFYFTLPRN